MIELMWCIIAAGVGLLGIVYFTVYSIGKQVDADEDEHADYNSGC